MALVEQLQRKHRVLILSRGYARQTNEQLVWKPGDPMPDPARFGDEPTLMARMLKNGAIAVGANRAELLQRIEQEFSDAVVILDDGFQHHRLARDLDIVIVDDRTVEHPYLLPSGDLREPLSALRRAEILLATSEPALALAHQWQREDVPVFRIRYLPYGLRGWKNNAHPTPDDRMILVTGIARPERMRQALFDAGVVPAAHFRFKDHQNYSSADARHLIVELERNRAHYIITTGKDAVKLERFPELASKLVVLEQRVEIDNQKAFLAHIDAVINSRT
jgi:tetraacyldisaccharide 4'-kinase